jgi:hypothetical protein
MSYKAHWLLQLAVGETFSYACASAAMHVHVLGCAAVSAAPSLHPGEARAARLCYACTAEPLSESSVTPEALHGSAADSFRGSLPA